MCICDAISGIDTCVDSTHISIPDIASCTVDSLGVCASYVIASVAFDGHSEIDRGVRVHATSGNLGCPNSSEQKLQVSLVDGNLPIGDVFLNAND